MILILIGVNGRLILSNAIIILDSILKTTIYMAAIVLDKAGYIIFANHSLDQFVIRVCVCTCVCTMMWSMFLNYCHYLSKLISLSLLTIRPFKPLALALLMYFNLSLLM